MEACSRPPILDEHRCLVRAGRLQPRAAGHDEPIAPLHRRVRPAPRVLTRPMQLLGADDGRLPKPTHRFSRASTLERAGRAPHYPALVHAAWCNQAETEPSNTPWIRTRVRTAVGPLFEMLHIYMVWLGFAKHIHILFGA